MSVSSPAAEPVSAASPAGVARQLWLNIAATGGARVFALGANLASLVITARLLGPAGRGTVAAVTTWVGLVSNVGYLSLGQVALHRASQASDRRWLGPTLGSLLALTAVVSLLGWAVIAALHRATAGSMFGGISLAVLLLGFAGLPFMVWEQYGSSLLSAIDRLDVYNRALVIGRTAGIALLVLLVAVMHWGVWGALAAGVAGQAIIAVAGLRQLLGASVGEVRADRGTVRELLAGGAQLHLNAIAAFLFTSSDVLFVQRYRGAAETGIYQLAVQLVAVMLVIPQAAAMVLYARVANGGPDAAWRMQRQVIFALTGGMVLLAVVGALLAPVVVPFVAGAEFAASVPVFQLLLPAVVAHTVSILMAPQWVGRGLFWQVSLLTLAAGAVNVGANLVLTPVLGMYGAVRATLLTAAVSLTVNVAMAVWVSRRVAMSARREGGS